MPVADVTPLAHRIHALLRAGDPAQAAGLLPPERPYPLDPATAALLGATPPDAVLPRLGRAGRHP
ncbi:hypothetical protein ACIQGZ_21115 [Streptomyces sp. NPDC092296]|uniref:hypothetical protein n=1 Tax=Streptomyces sp. NPDC092296 TaxID=3366012 RepID=UPI00380BEAF8